MDNDYASHIRQHIAALKLKAYRHRQQMDRLNAADNQKLAIQMGRAVILRMHEPEFLAVVKLVLPDLKGRPAANLRTALRAFEPDSKEEVPPAD